MLCCIALFCNIMLPSICTDLYRIILYLRGPVDVDGPVVVVDPRPPQRRLVACGVHIILQTDIQTSRQTDGKPETDRVGESETRRKRCTASATGKRTGTRMNGETDGQRHRLKQRQLRKRRRRTAGVAAELLAPAAVVGRGQPRRHLPQPPPAPPHARARA